MNRLTIVHHNYAFKIVLIAILFLYASCYSFKGVNIRPEIKTFFIAPTIIESSRKTDFVPGEFPIEFRNALQEKIRDQSSLTFTDKDPSIEFKSTIKEYNIYDDVREADNITSQFKLKVSVFVEYISNIDERNNWNKTFSHNIYYTQSSEFTSSQSNFNQEVYEQLCEQIFNAAFTIW